MSKIALMTLLNRDDSNLSPHFGKAKWMMIRDTEQGSSKFIQNHGLNGKTVVEALLREGCTDVICSEIGEGAVENLKRAQIHGWLAPANIPAPRLVEMLAAGSLQPVSATHSGQHEQEGKHSAGGCGCQHRNSDGHSGRCCHE